jgi:inhibitor of the pro-sigma K processing machinery
MGALLIYLINLIGTFWDFHIGLNYITAIFTGILGIPGAILLLILKLVLGF